MAEEEGGEVKPARKLPDPQTLLVLVNSLLIFVALGTMVYTKLIYQRPAITENVEIRKDIEESKKPAAPDEQELVSFDSITVNIAMTSGKAHYATVSFAVEVRDHDTAVLIKNKRALFLDRVIAALGHRQLTELNTIQGKLMLKTELLQKFNELAGSPGSVTDLYFSDFILQ